MQYLLFILFCNALAGQWIDPHDMDTKYVNKDSNQYANPVLEEQNSNYNSVQPVADDITFIYLKRVVSLLLTSATSDDQHLLKGIYSFEKDGENYAFLMKFTSAEKNDLQNLRQLDAVLKAAFSKKFSEHFMDNLVTANTFFRRLLSNEILTIIAACIALYIFYYLLKTNFTFWYIFRYFIFMIWIIDYAFRYQSLLEVSESF